MTVHVSQESYQHSYRKTCTSNIAMLMNNTRKAANELPTSELTLPRAWTDPSSGLNWPFLGPELTLPQAWGLNDPNMTFREVHSWMIYSPPNTLQPIRDPSRHQRVPIWHSSIHDVASCMNLITNMGMTLPTGFLINGNPKIAFRWKIGRRITDRREAFHHTFTMKDKYPDWYWYYLFPTGDGGGGGGGSGCMDQHSSHHRSVQIHNDDHYIVNQALGIIIDL
jgi:hypothetical protein